MCIILYMQFCIWKIEVFVWRLYCGNIQRVGGAERVLVLKCLTLILQVFTRIYTARWTTHHQRESSLSLSHLYRLYSFILLDKFYAILFIFIVCIACNGWREFQIPFSMTWWLKINWNQNQYQMNIQKKTTHWVLIEVMTWSFCILLSSNSWIYSWFVFGRN